MYSFNSRVRYSECDGNANMTVSSLVNYLQDTSTFHSEALKVGIEYLEDKHVAWLLSYWHIHIERYPKFGEEICISTWPYEFTKYTAYRNFTIKDKEGQVLAYANSVWVFVDMNKGRLKKIDEGQKELYSVEPVYPMEVTSRKISLPLELRQKQTFKVQRFCIDSNQHVNNEKYIMMAMEYLPENAMIKGVRVEYKNAAVLGDCIHPYVGAMGNKMIVLLGNETKKPFAIVEFSLEKQ